MIIVIVQVTSVADLPPPIVQIGPANQTLPLSSIATLPCQASSPEGEQPKIKWQKDGRPLQLGSLPRYSVKPGGTLEIDSEFLFFIVSVARESLTVNHFNKDEDRSMNLQRNKRLLRIIIIIIIK